MKYPAQITLLLGAAVLISLSGCNRDAVALKPASNATVDDSSSLQPREEIKSPDVVAIAQSPDGLSEAQKTSLSELGIPVVIPAYIPDGFQVSDVIANSCAAGSPRTNACREGPNYTLVYRNDQNTCLLMRAVGGGIGGGAGEFEFQTRTTLLGEVTILFGKTSGANQPPATEQLGELQPNLYSFPASLQSLPSSSRSPYYSLSAGDSTYDQETYGCGQNVSLTPLELEKIIQSLVLL